MEFSPQGEMDMNTGTNNSHMHILNETQFALGDSGYTNVGKKWVSSKLSTPFNRLYLVESGGADLYCDDAKIRMEPGMAYLLPAGLPCSYRCEGEMKKLYFHFNLYKPDHYDVLWGGREIGCIPMPEELYVRMCQHYGGSGFADALTLQEGVLYFLTEYLERYDLGLGIFSPYSPDVKDTIDYIHENLSQNLQIEQLAKRQFVSKSYLTAKFREETGVTLGQYIDEQQMIRAQQLLCLTNMSLETISKELGFCDQFYFSRRFKQFNGITPLQYRKKYRTF